MDIEERILTCRLIEQMNENAEYTKKLGLENESTYRGSSVNSIPVQGSKNMQSRNNHEKSKYLSDEKDRIHLNNI